jgi:hypothetical protein
VFCFINIFLHIRLLNCVTYLFTIPVFSEAVQNKALVSALPLKTFAPHMMGTNCMHMDVIPTQDAGCLLLRVCSGGDDQGLSVSHLLLHCKKGVDVYLYGGEVVMLLGASGSALKGVAVFDHSLLSVGYDQRLSRWNFPLSQSTAVQRMLDDFKQGVVREGDVKSTQTNDMVTNGVMEWNSATMIDVSDVAGISVSSPFNSNTVRAVVYGQGAQTFDYASTY